MNVIVSFQGHKLIFAFKINFIKCLFTLMLLLNYDKLLLDDLNYEFFFFLCISFHFPAILRHRHKCQTTQCDIYSRNCTMSSYIMGILMISKNFTLVFGKDISQTKVLQKKSSVDWQKEKKFLKLSTKEGTRSLYFLIPINTNY